MAITPFGKKLGIVVVAAGAIFGGKYAINHGYVKMPGIHASQQTSKVNLPNQEDAKVANVVALHYPSTTPSQELAGTPVFNIDHWEWSAQDAMFLASGGLTPTVGSLDEKYKVNVSFKRTDANPDMKKDVLACANQMHSTNSTSCTTGAVAFVAMGDSGGQWFADLNHQLMKFGPEYKMEFVGAVGRSNGEDALLGPAEWKTNPKSMIGKTIVGVTLDGDWNIALAYLGFNGIKNNPDTSTYDPTAVNWIEAPDGDYIKAVSEVYNLNKCEDRKEVIDGKADGKTAHVCPDGVVTWTPGDEQAVHGGHNTPTTKIISSAQYSAQMPAALFIIKKFADANRSQVVGFFAANSLAADQIKAFPAALKYASGIAQTIYNDQNTTADYWFKYFNGVKEQGQMLGGSAVFNIQDNLNFFGLTPGHQNNMKATYETFARIDKEQYPEKFVKDNEIPPYASVVDTSFIRDASDLLNNEGVSSAAAETVDYTADTSAGVVRSTSALYINFALNSSALTPAGKAQLSQLASSLSIAKSFAFEINGYTDITGNPASNIALSRARALTVKQFLQTTAPEDFPNSRFKSVDGYGSKNLLPNLPASDPKNRRVELLQIGSDQ